MARVSIAVNVRDLTRNELARMRHNFQALGQDMTTAIGTRNQANWSRLSQSISTARRDLTRLRGAIPDADFHRLDSAIRRSQATMRRGFSRVGATAFARLTANVQEVVRGFQDLDRAAEIRVRVDDGALERADAELARWRQEQERASRNALRLRIDTDRATAAANARIRRWATGPLRGLMGFVGGTLRDGIGQGLVQGFKSPTFAVILVAALVAAASVAGAAMAGALIFALGAGFVGLGGFIAAKSKEVTRNWEAEMKSLKKVFTEAAEPMIPVLHRATHILGDMGRQFAPKLEQALTQAAPMVNGFIDNTKRGFQKLGQNAWDDLQSSFRVFTVAFGPKWEDFLAQFGNSLGALARTVEANSEEIAMALRAVLGVINLIIDAINFLANVWVFGVHLMIDTAAGLLDIFAMILDAHFTMVDGMLGGMESVAKLFGFEDEAARAREAFNGLRDSTVGKLQEMSAQVKQFGIDMDYNNRKRKLEVDIAAWTAELERAKEELKSVPPSKKAELQAKIDDLMSKVGAARAELDRIRPNYYVRIHAYKTGDWALGLGGPQAHGGVTGNWGRAATGGARSNMTLVGEQGPELVDLAPGSHVRSNPDSRRLMGQGRSEAGPTTLIIKSNGSRASDLILELLRDAIHDAGGDPVRVLGG